MRFFGFLLLLLFNFTVHAGGVLIIGDSLVCGSFGKYLLQGYGESGLDVSLYCAVSSVPSNWINAKNPQGQICQTMTSTNPSPSPCGGDGKFPNFQALLRNEQARVIVALGTNSLISGHSDSSYNALVRLIVASGNPCVWVGPPHMNPAQSKGFPLGRVDALEQNLDGFYNSLIASVTPSCQLLDSRPATRSGTDGNDTFDGVHRTDKAGRYWARFLGILN